MMDFLPRSVLRLLDWLGFLPDLPEVDPRFDRHFKTTRGFSA